MKTTDNTTTELQKQLARRIAEKDNGADREETFEERLKRIERFPVPDQTFPAKEPVSWVPGGAVAVPANCAGVRLHRRSPIVRRVVCRRVVLGLFLCERTLPPCRAWIEAFTLLAI